MTRITTQGRDWTVSTHRDHHNQLRRLRDMPMERVTRRDWAQAWVVGAMVAAAVVAACAL